MSKETKLILPHYYISVEEPYKKDKGCVCIAKAVDKNNVSIIEQTYRNDVVKFFIELIDYVADLEAKLAEKDKAIENWQTMYESVVQTCHNDKEEIERLNNQIKQLKEGK